MVRFQCDGRTMVRKTWICLVLLQKSRHTLPYGKLLLAYKWEYLLQCTKIGHKFRW